MGRPRKKPDYNPDKVMKELLQVTGEIYEETAELKRTAEVIGLSAIKVRKLLITSGFYHNDLSDEINALHDEGKSVSEIGEITGLKKSSINAYLPYSKAIYNAKEVSQNAERIKLYRKRKRAVGDLRDESTEENLWKVTELFQEYPFFTVTGLPFSYVLKKGKDGTYNKELVISRREASKTVVWSSVVLAYHAAIDSAGNVIDRPKALGDIRGISYIYPMFYRFGLIDVPKKTADKMISKK